MKPRPSDKKLCARCGEGERVIGYPYCLPCKRKVAAAWYAANTVHAADMRQQWKGLDPDEPQPKEKGLSAAGAGRLFKRLRAPAPRAPQAVKLAMVEDRPIAPMSRLMAGK